MHELVFTFTTMALAKYMEYFHYHYHCCTSALFVPIYVRRYCGDFIFFTDELFIMLMFIVLRISSLLQPKHPVVTIAICTALFQLWCTYCDFSVAKFNVQERNEVLCLCGVACWL